MSNEFLKKKYNDLYFAYRDLLNSYNALLQRNILTEHENEFWYEKCRLMEKKMLHDSFVARCKK